MTTTPTSAAGDDAARISEIQERCETATPGPWGTWPDGTEESVESVSLGRFVCHLNSNMRQFREDAQFIAHARSDVPYLLAALRAARAEADRLRARTHELQERHDAEMKRMRKQRGDDLQAAHALWLRSNKRFQARAESAEQQAAADRALMGRLAEALGQAVEATGWLIGTDQTPDSDLGPGIRTDRERWREVLADYRPEAVQHYISVVLDMERAGEDPSVVAGGKPISRDGSGGAVGDVHDGRAADAGAEER